MTPEGVMNGVEHKLAAILSADVVGYSRLMAEDEDATVRTLTAYREEVALLVRQHRGRVADFTGDNFLAEFPAALHAVRCAVAIQRVLAALNTDLPADRRMAFRIGIHLGDVRVEEGRLYGSGVNIAARLEGLAEPGGICISATVRDQVESKLDLACEDLGEQEVKNIPHPVRVYRMAIPPEHAPREAGIEVRSRRWVTLGVGILLVATVAVAIWWRLLGGGAAPSREPIRSLAVLPLENLTGDPGQEYFADGMTEAVISEFARLGALNVISRTSVMQYKDARKPLPKIAQELGVQGVVEGSVFRAGDRVRITLQLIDARNDLHLWAQTYERDLRDVLALQGEIARAVAEQIRLKLTPQEQARLRTARTVDPEAHDAYLKGRLHLAAFTAADAFKAVELFEEAVERDPQHAEAWVGLADAYAVLGWGLWALPPGEAALKARPAAEQALALDNSLAHAHASLGTILANYDWRWSEAGELLRRALELSPADPIVTYSYGVYLLGLGRSEEALPFFERSVAASPASLRLRLNKAWALFLARHYERSKEELLQILDVSPGFAPALEMVGSVYTVLGSDEEAFNAFLALSRLEDRDEQWLHGAQRAYRESGMQGAARYWLAAETGRARMEYVSPMLLAQVSAYLGDEDTALQWLERAYEARHPSLAPHLHSGPYFDSLRSDPRFQDLLRRIGFPEE